MELLQVRDLSKKDERGFEIQQINFSQQPLHNLAIAGETGSGKSTLLRMIAGLVQPDSGSIYFNNQPVIGPADKLIPGHKGIVYLSQQFELPNFLRVEQILEYANELEPSMAAQLFSVCRIEHLFRRRTDQLSGGEKQRIAIARLLIMAPSLFLLDEPFSNMDQANKHLLKTIINDISEQLKISFIMISHDPLDTLSWAHELMIMQHGKIIQRGSPAEIYNRPVTEYCAGLFGRFNILPEWIDFHPGIPRQEGSLIIRPENVHLLPVQDGLQKAIIRRVNYFGHYYETEADMMPPASFNSPAFTILSRSEKPAGTTGDAVSIVFDQNKLHLIA
jgi:ABC-type Fe3+/spermidine/putrescine transport system ATPase subunit